MKPNANVVIGTYQSLVKKEAAYFDEFDAVIVDETHKAKSASIKDILAKCRSAQYKFGLSGTLPKDGTLDKLTLMSQTGPVITEVKAAFLQKEGHIAGCKVKVLSTPLGKVVEALLCDGVNIGVSSRGVGSVSKRGDVSYVGDAFVRGAQFGGVGRTTIHYWRFVLPQFFFLA